jgi:hypothetical protein
MNRDASHPSERRFLTAEIYRLAASVASGMSIKVSV